MNLLTAISLRIVSDIPTTAEDRSCNELFWHFCHCFGKNEKRLRAVPAILKLIDTVWAYSNLCKLEDNHYNKLPFPFTLKVKEMISNHNEAIKPSQAIFELLQGQTFGQIDGFDLIFGSHGCSYWLYSWYFGGYRCHYQSNDQKNAY